MQEDDGERRARASTAEGNGDDVDMAGFDYDDDQPMTDPTLVRFVLQSLVFCICPSAN